MLKNGFNKLFFLNEGVAITGNRFINFIAVFLILLTTYFCVGFAEGSKNYLSKKMADPYNKWICFDRHQSLKENNLRSLIANLSQILNQFKIENINQHNYEYQSFLDVNNEFGFPARGLQLSGKMNLLSTILNQNNVLSNGAFIDKIRSDFDQSHGIVITRKLLVEVWISFKGDT